MRLASFNIRGGRGADGLADTDGLRAVLAGLDADVLALQEVDRGQPRSGGVDQVALAAAATGLGGADHVCFEPSLGLAEGPAYGVALLSRRPVRCWRRVDLSRPARLAAGDRRRDTDTQRQRRHVADTPCRVRERRPVPPRPVTRTGDEPRVALAAVLDEPGPVATVVTTHLSFLPGVNARQLRRLAADLADLPSPVLLLGDLNLPGPLPRLVLGARGGWRALDAPATFPAHRPRMRLDQALLRGAPEVVASTRAVRAGVSDHRALVVELGERTGG